MYSFNSNFTKFEENIGLTERDRQRLVSARKEMRAHIRESRQLITPRFMTQGSFAYGTITKPARPSKQQMDLDDGVYFPSRESAKELREIVFWRVSDFASKQDWDCILKPKCVRATISSDAHIDFPVYSIPDDQLKTVTEARARAGEFSQGAGAEVNLLSYSSVEGVLLATDDGWIKSDPRVIHKWVQDSKEKYGKRFTKYSKFLKAWRDHQWEKSDFSSIMIMAGIEMALSEPDYREKDNVALDLEFIVRKVSMCLGTDGGGIMDPDGERRLDENLGNREEIIRYLERLANRLNKATKEGDAQPLIDEFGKRFPNSEGKKLNVAPAIVSGAASSPVISSSVVPPYGSNK